MKFKDRPEPQRELRRLGLCYTPLQGEQRLVPVRHKLDDSSWAALAAAYRAVGGKRDRL